jgi:cytochrome c peroxidase
MALVVFRPKFRLLAVLMAALRGCCLTAQEPSPEPEAPLPAATATASSPTDPDRTAWIAGLRAAYARPSAEWPQPNLDPNRPLRELAAVEGTTPDTVDPALRDRARLGLSLFYDVRLSKQMQVACVTCHDPQLGWSNGVTFSFGVGRKLIPRHPPTLIGVAHHPKLFWDGRAASLEAQAREVILNPDEMDGDPGEIVRRLAAEKEFYPPLFQKAFGDEAITFPRVLQAIAAFERTIRAGRSRFDSFLRGKAELTDSEVAGLHLFRTKARCINCHSGPMFTDGEFHNLGLTYYGRKLQDLGLYEQTRQPEDVGKFRTPTLRSIDRTAPYMHNGVFPSLEGVLRLYNAGMARPKPKENQKDDPLFPKTSDLLQPLQLSAQELADLRAFLTTLTEPASRVLFPPVPPLPGSASVPAPSLGDSTSGPVDQ